MPEWLRVLAYVSLAAGVVCAAALAFDLTRRPQKMAVMNVVWPVTALYFGPLALWAYAAMGRAPAPATAGGEGGKARPHKPLWQQAFLSTCHCGTGCTLGDIAGEWVVFLFALELVGSRLWTDYLVDFAAAYLLGIAFQYWAIVPMRRLSPWRGVWEAVKADTLSLLAFEVGMFGWMALMHFVLFRPPPEPTQAVYWFMMQVGMVVGFLTSYPANWLLVRAGVKEAM